MSSGEDPNTWKYFDLPVRDQPEMGRQPYYMNENGVHELRPHSTKEKVYEVPYADFTVVEQLARAVRRRRKVGLTTNVNQTGATLTSVAVVISTTGVRTCSQELRRRNEGSIDAICGRHNNCSTNAGSKGPELRCSSASQEGTGSSPCGRRKGLCNDLY